MEDGLKNIIKIEVQEQIVQLEESIETKLVHSLDSVFQLIQNNTESINEINITLRSGSGEIAQLKAELENIKKYETYMHLKIDETEKGIAKLNTNPLLVMANSLSADKWITIIAALFLFFGGASVIDLVLTNDTKKEQEILEHKMEHLEELFDEKLRRLDKIQNLLKQ